MSNDWNQLLEISATARSEEPPANTGVDEPTLSHHLASVTPISPEADAEPAVVRRMIDQEKLKLYVRTRAVKEHKEEEQAKYTVGDGYKDRLLDGETALFDMPEAPEAIWGEGYMIGWAKGQGTMLAGPTGLGKTTTAHNLLTRMIGLDESPFLGMAVRQTEAPILYLAMDRPIQTRQAFRRLIPDTPAARSLVKNKLRMWTGPFPFTLLDDPSYLAQWLQEQVPGCETVIFDSVKDMTSGVSEDSAGAAVQIAWQEVIASGMDFLALHHFRKSGTDADAVPSINHVYGSTWLTAGLGSVMTISGKVGEGNVTFHQHKAVMEQMPEMYCVHDYSSGTITLRDNEPVTVGEAILAAGDTGTTAEQIGVLCFGVWNRSIQQKVNRELNKLKKAGKAVNQGKPDGASAATPDTWVRVNMSANGSAGKWASLSAALGD